MINIDTSYNSIREETFGLKPGECIVTDKEINSLIKPNNLWHCEKSHVFDGQVEGLGWKIE